MKNIETPDYTPKVVKTPNSWKTVMPDTVLEKDGWYDSGFATDSNGQYVVMHYVSPAEYDQLGNRLPPPGEGLWYHRAGENVGDAVVHYQ